jgi:hypothetical protein
MKSEIKIKRTHRTLLVLDDEMQLANKGKVEDGGLLWRFAGVK